jgi:hypothetical protein
VRDVIGRIDAVDRNTGRCSSFEILKRNSDAFGSSCRHFSLDEPRCNCVGRHAELAELDSQRFGESLDTSFRRSVFCLSTVAERRGACGAAASRSGGRHNCVMSVVTRCLLAIHLAIIPHDSERRSGQNSLVMRVNGFRRHSERALLPCLSNPRRRAQLFAPDGCWIG